MPTTWGDIATAAMQEIGALGAEETPSDADLQFVLGKANRLIDDWNAERPAVYADSFEQFTLTPSLSPHTIGPTSATWTATIRPVSIEAAALVLNTSTPNVQTPIRIRDAEWWANLAVKTLTSAYPTDLFYEPDFPNGKLYFWPVPTTAYLVELWKRMLLATVVDTTVFTQPPGYQNAITLTLAEQIARTFGKQVPPDLTFEAGKARARIFANNDKTPKLVTRDAGMPSGGGGKTYNYLTRDM